METRYNLPAATAKRLTSAAKYIAKRAAAYATMFAAAEAIVDEIQSACVEMQADQDEAAQIIESIADYLDCDASDIEGCYEVPDPGDYDEDEIEDGDREYWERQAALSGRAVAAHAACKHILDGVDKEVRDDCREMVTGSLEGE